MKRFGTVALSAVVIALLIGVYAGQTPETQSPQTIGTGERASGIEPAAGQQPSSDAVEESIQRIEKTMEEMDKQNNAQESKQDQGKPGDQSRSNTQGIKNLNAPTEGTGDGAAEIINAESMKSDDGAKTGEAAARVQEIEPAAGDVEDTKKPVQSSSEQARPETSDNTTEEDQDTQVKQ